MIILNYDLQDHFCQKCNRHFEFNSTAVLTDSRTRPNRYALKVQLKVEKLKSFQPCYPNMYLTLISLRENFPNCCEREVTSNSPTGKQDFEFEQYQKRKWPLIKIKFTDKFDFAQYFHCLLPL